MKPGELQTLKKSRSTGMPVHLKYESISPATKLLEKRRLLYERHDKYEDQQKIFKIDEENFRQEEEEIKDKDRKIQEELIRYCKYLQDNDAKRARYIRKFKEEQKAKEAKDQEIQKLEKKLEEVQKYSSKLEQKMNSMRKYEDYLELVAKKSDRFANLDALYRHYASLENAQNKLTDLSAAMKKTLDTKRNLVSQLEREKSSEIVLLNNDITSLQKRLEDIEKRRQELQASVEQTTNEAEGKNLNLSKILNAIENIFSRSIEGFRQLKEMAEEANERKEGDDKKDNKGVSPQKDKKEDKIKTGIEEDPKKKMEEAIERLKKIGNHMSDFSDIIYKTKQELKQEEKQKKALKAHT